MSTESFGVMFHHYHNEVHNKCQGSYDAEHLIKLIDRLSKDYTLMNAQEYMDMAKRGEDMQGRVCLTFDDGLRCQYDIAYPVLKEKGLTAFWFIYTQPIVTDVLDKLELYHDFRFSKFTDIDDFYEAYFSYLRNSDICEKYGILSIMDGFTDDMYRPECTFYTHNDRLYRYVRNLMGEDYHELMNGMMAAYGYDAVAAKNLWVEEQHIRSLYESGNIVGLHSHSHHTAIHTLSYEGQRKEWSSNKNALEAILSGATENRASMELANCVKTVSYPCGNFNEDTIRIMKELGIEIGFADSMEQSRNIYGEYSIPRRDSTYFLRDLDK